MARVLPFRRVLRRVTIVAVLAIVLGVIAVWVVVGRVSEMTAPWYGRGRTLKPLPYRLVVGPVDTRRGIRGLTELWMPRKNVVAILGPPLVKRASVEEAESRGFIDPEDYCAEFFDGVFAWLSYNSRDRLVSMRFDLRGFADRFGGEQEVLIQHMDHVYLLRGALSRRQVTALIARAGQSPSIRVQGGDISIEGTGTYLEFDTRSGRLRSVTVAVP